jgi:E3 ubiquitin-protein ligase LRSAM1
METVNCMNNEDNTENFWLLQYQRLLDSQPAELSLNNTSIDSNFGYRLLINGVIHVVPFLMKIWRTKRQKLYTVTDGDLRDAGIRNENDRISVLKSISEYLNEYSNETKLEFSSPSAPCLQEDTSNTSTDINKQNEAITYCECVVCLDNEAQVLFLPCGTYYYF